MSTENSSSHFSLERLANETDRGAILERLENEGCHFIKIEARLRDLGSLGSALCALRARNVAVLVQVVVDVPTTEPVEAASAVSILREWDQLSLLNLVSLCRTWIPAPILGLLESEAKIEQMWMREWLNAMEDPRVHKIPGLPWRRFVRKIVQENFEYADQLFDLSLSDDPDKLLKVQTLSTAFLANKKKVVSIFPKKWGTKQ